MEYIPLDSSLSNDNTSPVKKVNSVAVEVACLRESVETCEAGQQQLCREVHLVLVALFIATLLLMTLVTVGILILFAHLMGSVLFMQ